MATTGDLGDGLIIRRATAADAEVLSAFNARVHGNVRTGEPDAWVGAWTRELLTRAHPNVTPDDFTVVEDTATGTIVSSLMLLGQTWSYAGIPFGVGQVELVATHPDYRRRGLVRRQMAVVHEWSTARGHLVQAITGILWYYRQFGYEYALAVDGGRTAARAHIPALAEGTAEPYRLRPATRADLPFVARVAEAGQRRSLIAAKRDAALWLHELEGRDADTAITFRVVETGAGDAIGVLQYVPRIRDATLQIGLFELRPGAPWHEVTPSVLRALRDEADAIQPPTAARVESFAFLVGEDHPAYRAAPRLLASVIDSYAWYIRVADLPVFLRRIAPVLEARLATSPVARFTGELLLNFFRAGLRLRFDAGHLAAIEPWPECHADSASASFPELTFLQLLFGYRSLAELRHAFPDCRVREATAAVVIDTLLPKLPSNVWAIQ